MSSSVPPPMIGKYTFVYGSDYTKKCVKLLNISKCHGNTHENSVEFLNLLQFNGKFFYENETLNVIIRFVALCVQSEDQLTDEICGTVKTLIENSKIENLRKNLLMYNLEYLKLI